MEASFCGGNKGTQKGYHFTTASLKEIGRDLCRSLIAYCDIPLIAPINEHKDKTPAKSTAKVADFFKNIKEDAEKELISKADTFNEDESNSGSDDSPSDGNLNEKLIKFVIPVSKNGKVLKERNEPTLDANPNSVLDKTIKKEVASEKEEEYEEDKKQAPMNLSMQPEKPAKRLTPNVQIRDNDKKVIEQIPIKPESPIQIIDGKKEEEKKASKVEMVDKATQTEKMDFDKLKQKAKKINQQIKSNALRQSNIKMIDSGKNKIKTHRYDLLEPSTLSNNKSQNDADANLYTIQNTCNSDSTKKIFNESYDVNKIECFPVIHKNTPRVDEQCKEKERRKSSESLYKAKTEEKDAFKALSKKGVFSNKVSPIRRGDRFNNI